MSTESVGSENPPSGKFVFFSQECKQNLDVQSSSNNSFFSHDTAFGWKIVFMWHDSAVEWKFSLGSVSQQLHIESIYNFSQSS